ncbi:hypothetical protein DMENIID0001_112920 [Sergentomyia squamirostris]
MCEEFLASAVLAFSLGHDRFFRFSMYRYMWWLWVCIGVGASRGGCSAEKSTIGGDLFATACGAAVSSPPESPVLDESRAWSDTQRSTALLLVLCLF